jgi:hypothetical protein
MFVEKFTRDGMVAVLISTGFGAGWSTWNADHKEFFLFDKGLVELAQEGATKFAVEDYLYKNLTGVTEYIDVSGWRDIDIRWVDEGTNFTIDEYDGRESINVRNDTNWIIA